MTPQNAGLAPPAAPGLSWRPLQPVDMPAVAALVEACRSVDGGLPIAMTGAVWERALGAAQQASNAAFDASGRLAAYTVAYLDELPREYRGAIVGQVHPAYRGRGIGAFLIGWSTAQAGGMLARCPADRVHVLSIMTESLTKAAAWLYERHGFTQQFAEDVMRRDLSVPLPDAPLPGGITLATWTPALAGQFFDAYQAAFRDRPGSPGWNAEEWIAWAAGDEDFRPDMSLLALHDGRPVGFIVCAEAWINQVGVRQEWRGRGIAAALVVEALRRFRAAGTQQVLLDVNVDNPSAAWVYARLGFDVVGRRARYAQIVA
jgi:mycothiol synthase